MKPSSTPLLAALLAVAACHHDAKPAVTTTAGTTDVVTVPAHAMIYPFEIGALAAVALEDGSLHLPNDAKVFGVGESPAAIGDVLAAAGKSRDTLDLGIQPLLVMDGEHVLLFDTGAAGTAMSPDVGQLQTSLAAAGVAPDAVTDIFLSHTHGDHVGGLVTSAGTLAFPHATIHMDAREWASFQLDGAADATRLRSIVEAHVVPFVAGASLLPEVTAVATPGHTPGHSSYLITSGADSLLYTGDVVHESILSVQRPDWRCAFDRDDGAARAGRIATLKHAADTHERLYAVHFPFPGLGHVTAHGDTFVWVPEAKR